jgi:hypothetical protein
VHLAISIRTSTVGFRIVGQSISDQSGINEVGVTKAPFNHFFELLLFAFRHICARQGTLHTYQNVGTGPGKALVILTPAGFEKFWMEIGKPVAGLTGPSGPPDPETIAKLMSLAPKYGLEMKGS